MKGGAVKGDGLCICGLNTGKREKILFFLLPPSPFISHGGLGPTSPIFHPNGTVYFYVS